MQRSRSVTQRNMCERALRKSRPRVLAAPAAALLSALLAIAGGGAVASAATSKAKTQLNALLSRGTKSSSRETVQMGEILGIGAPGSGEIIRVHSAWNTAKHVQADAVTMLIGRLGADLPSDQVVSTVDVTKGNSTWIKSTRAGAKWTFEHLPPAKKPATSLLSDLLKTAGHTSVKRISSSHGKSTWKISYTATDLQALDAINGQLGKVPALSAHSRSLLSGEKLDVSDLQVTFDSSGRVTDLRLGGVMTETRADATARHQPYPKNAIKAVVMLRLDYTYGGSLAITPPPASDVSNPKKALS